jgi:hypothetical protein
MLVLAGILGLLIAGAGWYYMFYSRAAEKLSGIEGSEANKRRVTLRRINGMTMCALEVVMYVGVAALARSDASGNARPNVPLFLGMMLLLLMLIVVLLVLGWMDLRLTRALRKRLHRGPGDQNPTP